MPTTSAARTSAGSSEASAAAAPAVPSSPCAVLIELEGVVVSARAAAFDALKSIFDEQGLAFTEMHMIRHARHPLPAVYMEELLRGVGAARQSVKKLVEDVASGMAMQVAGLKQPIWPWVPALLKLAQSRGAALGALSVLPRETAEAVMETSGLNALGVRLFLGDDVEQAAFPRPDSWLKIAKALRKAPHDCGAVVSSQTACKTAISAGMPCVVAPDRFTRHQDFGGAAAVFEGGDGEPAPRPEQVLSLLCPRLDRAGA